MFSASAVAKKQIDGNSLYHGILVVTMVRGLLSIHLCCFVLTGADKAVQHSTPFSFPWPLGSQFSMMGLSELKAAISLENDGIASSERQRIMKWTVDDVMSHVRTLGCVEQAKVFGEQVGGSLLQGQFAQSFLSKEYHTLKNHAKLLAQNFQ